MTATLTPVRFAGSTLGEFRHVCAFFDSADDEYGVMAPFIRDGIASGDRNVQFVYGDREDHLSRLRDGGVDTHVAQKDLRLDVRDSNESYMNEGRFDPDRMLLTLQQVLNEGRALGFAQTRLVAHAEQVMNDPNDAESFLEYEARLNYLLPQYPDPVICVYGLNEIGAGTAMDVLRTHPMVVIGGLLQENPFFVAPDTLLKEWDDSRESRRRSRKKAK
jgi:hypothetical protein